MTIFLDTYNIIITKRIALSIRQKYADVCSKTVSDKMKSTIQRTQMSIKNAFLKCKLVLNHNYLFVQSISCLLMLFQ